YDAYDGERWHPAADFRDVARFPEPALLPPGKVVRAEVTLLDLDGPWLPLPDRLISVDLNDIDWNEVAQTALVDRSVGSYRFTGTVVARTGL
ncbi:MAG: hypothetical protein GWN07_19890, partial [Actinobacteria bacterium]|nr:hypothetical protein [Actinomycetota bacterium]NIS32725.1 hypothetical protein [Actinomycetota bacterium]NIT96405.1 hypothetical protein [Actinomycetota bacterium]NIU67705.1 hypothetical protein [Actinomycetota bacterium]NIV56579.1 hypothetical protein [Actinomycetota bacterium]